MASVRRWYAKVTLVVECEGLLFSLTRPVPKLDRGKPPICQRDSVERGCETLLEGALDSAEGVGQQEVLPGTVRVRFGDYVSGGG